jgi:two-component system response regulator TrcR
MTSTARTMDTPQQILRAAARLDAVVTVLIVESDQASAQLLTAMVVDRGMRAVVAGDGGEGLMAVGASAPDVILLGADAAVVGGATFVRVLRRRSDVPIIVGVNDSTPQDAASILAAGASACVPWPFSAQQVMSMIAGSLPKSARGIPVSVSERRLQAGYIVLDLAACQVYVHGSPVDLPMRETQVLAYLMTHSGRVVTRQELLDEIWGDGYVGETNTLTVHIRRLRSRLGDDLKNPQIIRAVRGVGYRFAAEHLEAPSDG